MRVPYTGKPGEKLKQLVEQENVNGITADAIANKLGMARATAIRAIREVERAGYSVQREKEMIGTCYTISKPKELASQVH